MPTTIQRLRVAPLLAYEKILPPLGVSVAGRRLDISTPTWSAHSIAYWQPTWKTVLIDYFLQRRPGLFVDVGANIGQTLLDYVACSSRHGYLGFEPSVEAAGNVARIIQANSLDDCQIIPVGLSSKSGLGVLFQSGANDQCATTLEGLRPSVKGSVRTIATLRFDDLEVSRISMVKIDVEGAELSVLEGMRTGLMDNPAPVLCEILRRDSKADVDRYENRLSRLRQLITELGLLPYLVRKSSDLSTIIALERVDAFPLDPFSNETRHLNDYLLCTPDIAREAEAGKIATS